MIAMILERYVFVSSPCWSSTPLFHTFEKIYIYLYGKRRIAQDGMSFIFHMSLRGIKVSFTTTSLVLGSTCK